jgi:arylformamidase
MKVEIDGLEYEIDETTPIDISIPLRFDGPQPNAYGVGAATSLACEYGEMIGDTRRGGSCNFERSTLIPHCNGTHTECVGHITDERISVRECLQDVFLRAVLVSLKPETRASDRVITQSMLATTGAGGSAGVPCLIVRTLPNDDSKMSRSYDGGNIPPYFTTEAMSFIVECGFRHLLVDLPSIDRLFDEGKLANHRIFWNLELGSRTVNDRTRINSTVTELIYVANGVEDGEYLLNLQIAPFESDAAPSRPILFPIV